MKRYSLSAAALAFGLAFTAPALMLAGGDHPMERGDRAGKWKEGRLNAMTERLKLNDEQKKSFESAMKTKQEKMKALHDEFEAKRKAIADDFDKTVTATLTDKQKAEYSAMKEEKEKRHDEFKKGKDRGDKSRPGEDR